MSVSSSSRLHCVAALLLFASAALANAEDKTNLGSMLEEIRKSQRLPGMAAVVMRDGAVIAEGAAGVRKLGEPAAITVEDRFGIGSCTKRMTGFLISRLVDEGKLKWDMTLGDTLTDIPMREEYRSVTLAQLLSFTGGIAGYERIGPKITPELFDTEGTHSEREQRFAKHVLNLPPATKPGTSAIYSNASFFLAALMASKVTGKDFDSLMQAQVFSPLKLNAAGWGRPRSESRRDQPWQHVARPDGHVPEPDINRPPEVLFRAAGGAHMSVKDLALFGQADLQTRKGQTTWLKPATAQRWLGLEGVSAGERSVHAGGTPWLSACYAVWPKLNMVAAIAVNGGSPDDEACKAFVREVEARYGQGTRA